MMKMTMFIDEALLQRVMKMTGLKTKTETVEFALRETERKSKLARFLANREKLSADEWKNSVDPNYDLMRLRLAEKPGHYRAKRGSR
jgi:Arc/MetJ family transcription regulator